MRYKGIVIVEFKKSVLEPQGQAALQSLSEHGHEQIESLRVGKYIEVLLNDESEEVALKRLETIAEELLYNPVMETCHIKLEEL